MVSWQQRLTKVRAVSMGNSRWGYLRRSVVVTTLILGLVPAGMAEAGNTRKAAGTAGGIQPKPLTSNHARRTERPAMPLIVIDPGHGGRDSGAIGLSGTREKDITLATAHELERQIK